MLGIPPLYDKPQADERCEETRAKVRERGYITAGKVKALTAFFSVQKGEEDNIRVVYDGSVSELNEVLWVPRFVLPTLWTHLRAVENGTFMADVNIGEMLLNFNLHEGVRPYAGVDLTHYFPDGSRERVWEAWGWAAMGLTLSPFQAVQGMAYAAEVIFGDRKDPEKPVHWDWVWMNLPGQVGYDPSKPWVSKIREEDGRIAGDMFSFVDDLRPTSTSKEEAWKAARRIGATLGFLGLQDASRKRRDGSQTLGAWSGLVIRTGEGGVWVMVSQDKWDNAKSLVAEMQAMVATTGQRMDRIRLEQIRGF
jgi:hypothetical protein